MVKKRKKAKKKINKKIIIEEDNKMEDIKNEEIEESEKTLEKDLDHAEEEIKKLESIINHIISDDTVKKIEIKASKPISQLKKGDKIKVDGIQYDVDAHYVLIDHGKTKEMTIEIFNPNTDNDYQLRYFSDQMETSMEFYELQEILYVRKPVQRVEW